MKIIKMTIISLLVSVSILANISVPASTVLAANGNTTVYITKTGKCYHTGECKSLRQSKIKTTLQDAAKNYAPCSKCNPPELDKEETASEATSINNTNSSSSINDSVTYIGNLKTKKFHTPTCGSAAQIAEKNKKEFTGSRDDVVNLGYEPCKKCNP